MKFKLLFSRLRKRAFMPFNYNRFWNKRYKKYGFDIYYCGNKGMTKEENIKLKQDNLQLLDNILKKLNIDKDSKILDIGCGVGVYAKYFKEQGYKNYTGIEFLEDVVKQLRIKFPDYTFTQKDICKEEIEGKYDLIIMFSVTQHIIKEKYFDFIMNNVKEIVNNKGHFLVTDTLEDFRDSIYTKRRTLEHYELALNHLKLIKVNDFGIFKLLCFKNLRK